MVYMHCPCMIIHACNTVYFVLSSYEKQRTIMRTGHTPLFAYLLMSGSVFVNIEMKSQDDKKKKFVRTAAVLQRGSLFGVSVFHLCVCVCARVCVC